jgi:D-3-phosphoglycerate dehydrogenase
VLAAGVAGRLKAAVKWGVGTDNVDFDAARELGLPITNTPRMFGAEVADVALGYAIGLARQLFAIDRSVRAGGWTKPRGISLAGKRAGVVGFGDIGRALCRRLLALGMQVDVYDPGYVADDSLPEVTPRSWPAAIDTHDFVFLVCALTPDNHHLLSTSEFARMKSGVRVVNVSRGPLIDEAALCEALGSGRVHSAALDVFEDEPLPETSPLRGFGERVLFGSHNASNTEDAVIRASHVAIDALCGFLGVEKSVETGTEEGA